MAKPKKEIKEEEEIKPEVKKEPVVEAPAVNNELLELLSIHNAMSLKGIKDIGQLEVLISRLQ